MKSIISKNIIDTILAFLTTRFVSPSSDVSISGGVTANNFCANPVNESVVPANSLYVNESNVLMFKDISNSLFTVDVTPA